MHLGERFGHGPRNWIGRSWLSHFFIPFPLTKTSQFSAVHRRATCFALRHVDSEHGAVVVHLPADRFSGALGIFGFLSQIPMLLLSSVGGYVGDRYSRHKGVIATQTVSMLLAFLLAGMTLTHKIHDRRGAWVVIIIGLMQGIVNAFDVPIRQSFFVNMVGKADLPNAIALNSSIFNGARVFGPAIAGFAINRIGEGLCFLVNGLSFLAVIIALLAMRIPPQEEQGATHSPWRSLLEGFQFAMR